MSTLFAMKFRSKKQLMSINLSFTLIQSLFIAENFVKSWKVLLENTVLTIFSSFGSPCKCLPYFRYYCASIVQMAGVPDKKEALLYSALITAVYGIIGVAVLFFIDTVGRRKMLIGSSIGLCRRLFLSV